MSTATPVLIKALVILLFAMIPAGVVLWIYFDNITWLFLSAPIVLFL